jgi:hypothetical protein
MSTATADTPTAPTTSADALQRTARSTGLWYIGLGVTGMLGFLLVRQQLFVAGNADETLANLTERATLARVGIALEMGIVLTQALTAMWFYRLFRGVDSFSAGAVAAFGLVNSVMISASAACLATALDVAGDNSLSPGGDSAATAQLLYVVSEHLWGIGAVFFGLWLIPMGWLAMRSGWFPRPLGWLLMVGGAGYVLSAFVGYLFIDADTVAEVMTVPATVGEFWMLGLLIIRGIRRRDPTHRTT